MAFCPVCRAEYLPHVFTCPECEVTLVETLPEPGPSLDRVPTVEVYGGEDHFLLQMAIGLLQENGIPFIFGKPDAEPFRLEAPKRVLRVLESDAARARELFDVYLKSEGAKFFCESCGAELSELPETCPKCGKSPTG